MNRKQFNGGLIGNGVTDNRSFLTLSTIATATTSALLVVWRYLAGTTVGRAIGNLVLAGSVYMTGSTTAGATGSLEMTAERQNQFPGMDGLCSATSTISLIAKIPLAGTTTAVATSTISLCGLIAMTGSALCRATGTLSIAVSGFPAPDERTMTIPFENRTMVVQ
ncbi:MAG: hypothetical protein WAW73_17485 [Rhodoferax sp.]